MRLFNYKQLLLLGMVVGLQTAAQAQSATGYAGGSAGPRAANPTGVQTDPEITTNQPTMTGLFSTSMGTPAGSAATQLQVGTYPLANNSVNRGDVNPQLYSSLGFATSTSSISGGPQLPGTPNADGTSTTASYTPTTSPTYTQSSNTFTASASPYTQSSNTFMTSPSSSSSSSTSTSSSSTSPTYTQSSNIGTTDPSSSSSSSTSSSTTNNDSTTSGF